MKAKRIEWREFKTEAPRVPMSVKVLDQRADDGWGRTDIWSSFDGSFESAEDLWNALKSLEERNSHEAIVRLDITFNQPVRREIARSRAITEADFVSIDEVCHALMDGLES